MADGIRAALGGVNITGTVYGCRCSTAVAGAAIVALTTSNHPTLANYSNSGVALGVRTITLQQIADAANAPSSIILGFIPGIGSGPATGAPIASGTPITSGTFPAVGGTAATLSSRYMGGTNYTPKATWYPAAVTFTTAPGYWRPAGQTLATLATATAAIPHSTVLPYSFVLAPGSAFCIANSTTTSTVKYIIEIEFDEIVLA